MTSKNKSLGQFFTPEFIADFMVGLSSVPSNGRVLEPSSGTGVFLKALEKRKLKKILAYEIDRELEQVAKGEVKFESFISAKIVGEFDLAIGNPPYVRWKNLDKKLKNELEKNPIWKSLFNSLCDYLYVFIVKSVELLKEGGELIFITPEYWITTGHARALRNYLVKNGYFTDIFHFSETPIFDKVASSIIIFRFIKSSLPQNNLIRVTKHSSSKRLTEETLREIRVGREPNSQVFNRTQFRLDESWILAPDKVLNGLVEFERKCVNSLSLGLEGISSNYTRLSDIARIGNGLVSGLDQAFQVPKDLALSTDETSATLPVLKAKNIQRFINNGPVPYFFLNGGVNEEEALIERYPNFYKLLSGHREKLEQRYNYDRKVNYWEWAFPRSFSLFSQKVEKIFIPCKERISHKSFFRFTYVPSGIFPTQDVTAIVPNTLTRESIHYLLVFLNSQGVFNWLRHKGIVKGNIVEFSEKPLASIPMRLINWSKDYEIKLHDEITQNCKDYLETKDQNYIGVANQKLTELLNIL